ncbi:MAG: GNAT family N-acetyltransferase, partial [Fimbriimonadaceae bacterium]|nr:GNAT family N-acetyltransferase [Alphaproteobacteria bacterium]
FFFVAESDPPGETDKRALLGFVIGDVRAWEFGSAPCGWVFAIAVNPDARQSGLGEALLQRITDSFKEAGVVKLRTMVRHRNNLMLSFFRSEGLAAGPYLQLEKDLT